MRDQQTRTDDVARQSDLLQLFERLTDLMILGDHQACQSLVEEHPQYAEELKSVLPAIRMMHEAVTDDSQHVVQEPSADTPIAPQGRLGDFQLIREVGRGGMGVVYEAEQLLLGRRVALKVLPLAAMLDERQRLRFQNEARAAATLSHSHIVPIHFVGVDRGIHFYAMQFVPGRSLGELLCELRSQSTSEPILHRGEVQTGAASDGATVVNRQNELTTLRDNDKRDYFRKVAQLTADIAEGLQHAHERGVVHRDIKPSNLLIDQEGRCLIGDFGLARLEGDAGLTCSGDIVGTLRYAPPEQVLGGGATVDHRADIYSLGATLYELLTLAPAMEAKSREALLREVAESTPRRPRTHNPSIPADLETIVCKSMERDPDDRFATAEDMAQDLRRFVAGRPLLIRRPSLVQRGMKWVKRHPKLMMATTAMLFVFLTGTAASLIAVNRERSETAAQRDAAQENLQLAISALDEVYHEIGSHWIDSDRNLTDTQARFLRRSAQLLTEIANRFPASSTSYASAGLAHLHAANANARTHAFKEAATGYDRSSRLLAKAIDVEPHITSLRESLATAEFQRARLFRKRWRLDDAAEAYRASRAQAQHLLTAEPGDDRHLVHAFSVDAELLSLAALKLDDEHVVEQGLRMKLQLEQLSEADPDRVHLQLVRLELMRRLSSSMRRLNRADEALAICRDLAKDSAFPLQDSQDHRQVARSLAGIIAEIGRCQLELGDYTKAEQHLRDGMARLRQSFLFDGTPKEFSMAYMRHEASHDLMEPDAFAQYAGVQASLASVLDKTNQRQLALAQAEEAVRSCLTLNYLFPMIPAYALDTVECALVLTELRGRAASDEQIMSIEKLILNVDRQLRTYARFRQPPRRFIESLHAFRTTNNLDTERVTEDAPEGT